MHTHTQINYFSNISNPRAEFKRLSKIFHPDKVSNDQSKHARFIFDDIRNSYLLASNPIANYLFSKYKASGVDVYNRFTSEFIHIEDSWRTGKYQFDEFKRLNSKEIDIIYWSVVFYLNEAKESWFRNDLTLSIHINGNENKRIIENNISTNANTHNIQFYPSAQFKDNLYEHFFPFLKLSVCKKVDIAKREINLKTFFDPFSKDCARGGVFLRLYNVDVGVKGSIMNQAVDSLSLVYALNDNSTIHVDFWKTDSGSFGSAQFINVYQLTQTTKFKCIYVIDINSIKIAVHFDFKINPLLKLKVIGEAEDGIFGIHRKGFDVGNINVKLIQNFKKMKLFAGIGFKHGTVESVYFGLSVQNFHLNVPIFLDEEFSVEYILIGAFLATSYSLIQWFKGNKTIN